MRVTQSSGPGLCRFLWSVASAVSLSLVLLTPLRAAADPVLDWNALAVTTLTTQPPPGVNPFAQARFMAITQLAVFEAVNAITGQYEPYLEHPVTAPAGSSAEAAAVAAAHKVLVTYFAGNAATVATLDAARTASLAAISASATAKANGVAVGEAAAIAMMANRVGDGATPVLTTPPLTSGPGAWQLTPSCAAGVLYSWRNVKPFGIESVDDFLLPPPPALDSRRYEKDLAEVDSVGAIGSTERPQDRTDVARFYAATSPSALLNSAARQVAAAKGHSLSQNARSLALLNMSTSDSLVASFNNKYEYNFWRPVTAIREGGDLTWTPLISTPCFPSYPSNHGSGSNGGAEILRRIYGASGHSITITNPAFPTLAFQYSSFKQICDDISDARVFGGIHFRFEQEAGADLGRAIATAVYKNNLQPRHGG